VKTPDHELRPRRRPDVESVDIDGELVLWDAIDRTVHRLDPIGSVLWPFLDGDATVAELAEDAAEVWGVPIEQTTVAVRALVEQLGEARLLGDAPPDRDGQDPKHLVDPPSP
jgi:hypothetical protein